MTETKETQKLILRDTDFMSMMQRRIFNVLLVANPYDAFMLEDDGRIDEKVFEELSKYTKVLYNQARLLSGLNVCIITLLFIPLRPALPLT